MALLNNQKACLAMVFTQLLYAGMALLSKAALNKGMGCLVFVVYRQGIAMLAMAPVAYIVERWGRFSHSCYVYFHLYQFWVSSLLSKYQAYHVQ